VNAFVGVNFNGEGRVVALDPTINGSMIVMCCDRSAVVERGCSCVKATMGKLWRSAADSPHKQ
jgi:hypothetical protein